MLKNPWFTLVIGLMVGLALGYVFAERQAIPPGKALRLGAQADQQGGGGLPDGHPPVEGSSLPNPEAQALDRQIAEIQTLLTQNPDDAGLMIALANTYFDGGRWPDARLWYERVLADEANADPNVITDLAVVYRNLQEPQRALELLDRATSMDEDHWQAWYNKVVVMQFDLHDHDGAREAFLRLKSIAAENPQVPDLAPIEREVMGS
jgi:tetratricopeptide (TPR) repeat protein